MDVQASSMTQSVADTAQQAKRKVQEEFDMMQPRSQEDQAWIQGKIASNTQQQPSFQGSGRKIITETQPESQGRIPSNTSASRPGVGSSSQGEGEAPSGEFANRQGRKAEGQVWKETKAQAEQKAGKVEEKASSAVDQVKDAVKSVSGVSHMLLTCNRMLCACLSAYVITSCHHHMCVRLSLCVFIPCFTTCVWNLLEQNPSQIQIVRHEMKTYDRRTHM